MAAPWPPWSGRWYGVLLRILMALFGSIFGLYLVAVGYYTAVDWKTGESDWTIQAVLIIAGGLIVAAYCLWGALRPSKVSFLPPAVLILAMVMFGALALIDDLFRGSAT